MSEGVKVENKFAEFVEQVLYRNSNIASGFVNRVIYPQYQNAMKQQFISVSNKGGISSEGNPWKANDPAYSKLKLKKFAAAPYGGAKMLVAKGKLAASMLGDPAAGGFKTVHAAAGRVTLTVGTTLKYAAFVNQERKFTRMNPARVQEWGNMFAKYMAGK